MSDRKLAPPIPHGSPQTTVAREADPTPNKLVVSLDGDVAAAVDLGASHHGPFALRAPR